MKPQTYSMTEPLIERLKSAVWHTIQKPDGYHNVSQLVRAAVDQEVTRLEAKYNHGRPFPKVTTRLPTGPSPEGAMRGAQIRARNRRRASEQDPDHDDSP
ncbi:ParB family protein [Streptantibioticus ferralitis]|uniref:Centromere-binding protein ParB C-terminal domain-containing protein n=1 Tax=Streptantibioticus ferralitis TaxID=236510 RepID=A0ABT5ZAU0_9ACTN|nr:hypothetical protein [Streptantibioticus ferralitis]MDF2260944.1 hypothetical protein [Streptantibioticus ferralitis]